MTYTRALGFWLAILVLAFLNGGLRELILVPSLGAPWALLASDSLLMLFVLLTAYVAAPRLGTTQTGLLLVIGGMWLSLTLGFEFGFGRLVQGKPWSELLNAYRFENGNIWPLVLLVVFLGPLLAARFRSARDPRSKTEWPSLTPRCLPANKPSRQRPILTLWVHAMHHEQCTERGACGDA